MLSGQRGSIGEAGRPEVSPRRIPLSLTKGNPEVIEPPFAGLPCDTTITFYSISEDNPGFVTGTNSFFDVAKGQRFIYDTDGPYEILEIGVAFANRDSAALDSFVSVQLFTDFTSGGNLVGTSDSIRVRDVALSGQTLEYTVFTFPDSVIIERDSFVAMVDLSDTYTQNPQYMSIFSTLAGCGDGDDAFEFFFDADANLQVATINDSWQNAQDEGLDIGFIMYALVEPLPTTSSHEPVADYRPRIVPNPVFTDLTLTFTPSSGGSHLITLVDVMGRTLRQQRMAVAAGRQATVTWDLRDVPAGFYAYRIDGPAGLQAGKLVKR
jgi:hypothetical protein